MDKNEYIGNLLQKSIKINDKLINDDITFNNRLNPNYLGDVNYQPNFSSQGNDNENKPLINDANLIVKLAEKSKLPEHIKNSFINKPLVINTENDMDDIMRKLSDKMINEGVISKIENQKEPILQETPIKQPQQPVQMLGNIDKEYLEYIIEKTVHKVLENVYSKETLEENIKIKINDKIYSGVLKTSKEIKPNY